MIEIQYFAPKSVQEYKRLIRIILIPVMAVFPLYGLCLLTYRVVSLLKIGIPDCGCPEAKRKLLSFIKKKERISEDLFPPHDNRNECSPLISNRED